MQPDLLIDAGFSVDGPTAALPHTVGDPRMARFKFAGALGSALQAITQSMSECWLVLVWFWACEQ